MAGSRARDGPGPAPAGRAGAAAAGGGRRHAAARPGAAHRQGRAQRRRDAGGTRGRGDPRAAGRCSRRRPRRDLPRGQLARTVRHRAGAGPALGGHAAADRGARTRCRAVFAGALAPLGAAFPPAVPVAADGTQRRLPYRRPVQPVRLLRGDAGRVLRPGAARLGPCAGDGRTALHRGQPRCVAPVPARRGPGLRRLRDAQPRRPLAADPAPRRHRPCAAGSGRRAARHRLPDQGRAVAAELLAARHLHRGVCAGGGAVGRAHQGGRVRGAAHVAAAVRSRGGRVGRLWRRRPAVGRAGDARGGQHRCTGFAGPRPAGRLLRAGVVRHRAGSGGDSRCGRGRGRAVLPCLLDPGAGRAVPAARTGGACARAGRRRAGRHPRGVR